MKDNKTIAGETGTSLSLSSITGNTTGTYQAQLIGDGEAANTVLAHLIVRPATNHPLVNLSTRASLSPASPEVTIGFVVPERINSDYLPKALLLRAVGPGLAGMDVPQPLPDPRVRIYDSEGVDITPIYAFAELIYNDGSTPRSRYYQRVVAASVGAFSVPVPTLETPVVLDYAEIITLPSGVYTMVVDSLQNLSGEVVVAIHEIGL
ncbi:MAG: hypothetical protein J6386_08260 [Candidatus Synoicihabitans palmerolidicus]|nr:hypothetical protein [Candidatus Synoicihabitans palmerolidicus]